MLIRIGCQNLQYSLIDLETFEILQQGSLPLAKRTTLTWVGFTAEGAPAMYDSTGLLSVLDCSRRPGQARWVPYFDSDIRRAGKPEIYWPVGLNSNMLSCIVLKVSNGAVRGGQLMAFRVPSENLGSLDR